jgi:hypothetical protein
MKFLKIFFAEIETLCSQGPVTRDFCKSYWIRPRYLTLKHFRVSSASDKSIPRTLSQRINSFRICSASDEIRSAYAQHEFTCKNVHILPLAEHARKFVPRMLSM